MITKKTMKPIKREVEVTPTVAEIAYYISEMDSRDHARLLNLIATFTKEWNMNYCFQLNAISNEAELSDNARRLMREIGNYSFINKEQ